MHHQKQTRLEFRFVTNDAKLYITVLFLTHSLIATKMDQILAYKGCQWKFSLKLNTEVELTMHACPLRLSVTKLAVKDEFKDCNSSI